jgi:hypothetical protein
MESTVLHGMKGRLMKSSPFAAHFWLKQAALLMALIVAEVAAIGTPA